MFRFEDITQNIIPFFNKYPLEGIKKEDLADFCKGAEIMQSKVQYTREGFIALTQLKEMMNRGRKLLFRGS